MSASPSDIQHVVQNGLPIKEATVSAPEAPAGFFAQFAGNPFFTGVGQTLILRRAMLTSNV